jgi:hypothetical protein
LPACADETGQFPSGQARFHLPDEVDWPSAVVTYCDRERVRSF